MFLDRHTRVDFARAAIVRALTRDPTEAVALAESRFGRGAEATRLIKAGVAGATPEGYGGELVQPGALEFLASWRPQTIIGRAGLRRVPADVPIVAQAGMATAYWTAAGRATPVSSAAFERERLRPLRVSALVVASEELLQASDGEDVLADDLTSALVEAEDRAFVDPANTGTPGEMPASVTHDGPSIASTGDLGVDLVEASDDFDGQWSRAVIVAHPRTALQIALAEGGLGLAVALGPRGGELATVPVICSEAVPWDSNGGLIVLMDTSAIVYTDDAPSVSRSSIASVEMADNPTGHAGTPTGATSVVNLYQSNSVGLLATARANWLKARPASVVCITGANYGRS
ncbi:MAG: phage major capsid protein [Rubrivivax sp.]|nr:phage major capsid protein [Rubrivivax sp.]